MKLSNLSQTLIGSEIVKLGTEIRERIRKGERIYNFTVGDFDPKIFPIPKELEDAIVDAFRAGYTNYPPPDGTLELRQAIAEFARSYQGLEYATDEILVSSGGRPLIYATFRAICDQNDKIVYAVPSWNNNHYVHFISGVHQVVEAREENNFMPLAKDIAPHLEGASLLALCSPQNPTGTTFRKEELAAICEMVVAENNRRGPEDRKLYVMYDQMYWHLTYDNIEHYDPVTLNPEMKPYTVFIDAISKVFAATGVRVGWSMGPAPLLLKMRAILSHVGSWAPMAEQRALSQFLGNKEAIDRYLSNFKSEIEIRLRRIYEGLIELKKDGHPVDAIAPEAAIYLTIKIDLKSKKLPDGSEIKNQEEVTSYLLQHASLAVVPFYAFGASRDSAWYRLSIGTSRKEELGDMLGKLRHALEQLS